MSAINNSSIKFVIFFSLILLFGGWGVDYHFYSILFTIVLTSLFYFWKIKINQEKVHFPPYFRFYFVFLALSAISLLWSQDIMRSLKTLLLFIAGGGLWVLAFNFDGRKFGNVYKYSLSFLVVFYSIMFVLNSFVVSLPQMALSLFATEPAYKNHYYIGDLWALALSLLLLIQVGLNKKLKIVTNYTLILVGIFFVLFSGSRSAIVSIVAGILYLYVANRGNINKGLILLMVVLLCAAILVFGLNKSIFLERPYYVQALLSLVSHPLGVSLGNFWQISTEFRELPGADKVFVAESAHNLLLEVITSLGVLSVPFVIWFISITKEVLLNIKKEQLVYGLTFVVLTTNFLFTEAYFIPSMLFLWFLNLGSFQRTIRS